MLTQLHETKAWQLLLIQCQTIIDILSILLVYVPLFCVVKVVRFQAVRMKISQVTLAHENSTKKISRKLCNFLIRY